MAVSWVACTPSLQNTNASGVTFSHAGGTCDAFCCVVDINGTTQTLSSITWNGTTVPTQMGTADLTYAGNGYGRIYVRGLAPADTGTHNVIVTLNASNASWDAVAITYLGASQVGGTTTFNGWQTALSTGSEGSPYNLTVTVTTGATGDIVQDATISNADDGDTAGTDWQDNSGSSNTQGKHYAGGASVVCTESWTTTSGHGGAHRIVAWNVAQSAAVATLVQAHYRWRNDDGRLWAP